MNLNISLADSKIARVLQIENELKSLRGKKKDPNELQALSENSVFLSDLMGQMEQNLKENIIGEKYRSDLSDLCEKKGELDLVEKIEKNIYAGHDAINFIFSSFTENEKIFQKIHSSSMTIIKRNQKIAVYVQKINFVMKKKPEAPWHLFPGGKKSLILLLRNVFKHPFRKLLKKFRAPVTSGAYNFSRILKNFRITALVNVNHTFAKFQEEFKISIPSFVQVCLNLAQMNEILKAFVCGRTLNIDKNFLDFIPQVLHKMYCPTMVVTPQNVLYKNALKVLETNLASFNRLRSEIYIFQTKVPEFNLRNQDLEQYLGVNIMKRETQAKLEEKRDKIKKIEEEDSIYLEETQKREALLKELTVIKYTPAEVTEYLKRESQLSLLKKRKKTER